MILLDYAGFGLSSGAVPRTVTEMARDAIAFLDALELSHGGHPRLLARRDGRSGARVLRPRAVRRMALAGTGPRGGGRQMHGWIHDIEQAANTPQPGPDEVLQIFFEMTETSRAVGLSYVQRIYSRSEGRMRRPGPRWREFSTTPSSNGAFPMRPSSTGWRPSGNRCWSPTATTTG